MNNMTQGSIAKALTAFTVPLILSGVFQQMFNWVDAFIVGNVEGELALAGIGAVTSTYSMFVMIIVGFTSGLSVLAAQRFGMGRPEDLGPLLVTFSVILGGIYLAVCTFGAVFAENILIFLDTPANIFQNAEDYLRIMFTGIPFLALYNTCCAVLRGLGDSRAPFSSVMVCCVINVFLDLIFVAGLRLGTAGAAIATVLSQIAMTVYILWYAAEKYPFLRPRRGMFRRETAGEGTRFGIPPAIQSGTTSFGNIILQRFMNGFGDQTVAAITTAYRVDSVLLLPIINFGSGIATVVGQVFSFLLGAAYLPRFRSTAIQWRHLRIRLYESITIVTYGMSNSFNQVAITLVQIVLNNSLVHYGALSPYGKEIPLAAAGIVMGGNVRVGFEDNIYLERGHKAASNGELVAKVVALAKLLGREVATPDEARRILSLTK